MVSKKDKYLAAAQKFLERGQLDKALAEFGKVLQEDPKDTRTLLKIAELHAKRSDAEKATEIYLRTAEVYTEQGFFQKAVAVYKNVLKLNPDYVQGHFKLADLFKQLGLVSDAMQQYEMAAAVHQKAGRTIEALDALRQIVEINSENVVSRIKLAEAAVQAGAVDEAVREFARAADQLKSQGRVDEYLKVAERLLFYQPDDLALARELAEAYIARNNARFALPKLQVCFKAEPRDPTTLGLLARAFEQLGQIPKTISVLRELAKLCHEQGRSAERNEAVRKILSLDPNDAEAREAAGRYGLLGGSRPPGSSAVAPFPSAPGSRSNISVVTPAPVPITGAGQRPRSSPSVQAIDRRGIEAEGDDAQRIIAESDVFVKYGLLERAADHIRRVFELDRKNVTAREKLVAVLVQLGRISDAVAELETVAEQLAARQPEDAAEFARRALALDPRSVRAKALLEAIETSSDVKRTFTREPSVDDGPTPEVAGAFDGGEVDEAVALEASVEVDVTPEPAPALEVEGVVSMDDSGPLIEIAESVSGPAGAVDPDATPIPEGPESELSIEGLSTEVEEDEATRVADRRPEGGSPVLELVAPPADDGLDDIEEDMELIDAEEELTPGEFAQVQRTTAGESEAELETFEGDTPTTQGFDDFDTAHDRATRHVSDPLDSGWNDVGTRAAEQAPDLREVDRLVKAGRRQDARALLTQIGDRHPGNPLVADKWLALDGGSGGITGALPQEGPTKAPAGPKPRAMVAQGESADLSTHKDLGIAYQQMGLFDAAITEFQLVTQDPRQEVFALQMVGECLEAKGSLTDAVMQYKKALNCPSATEAETTTLYYALGSVYDRLGDLKESLYYFEKVQKRESGYRDVGKRIADVNARARGAPKGGSGGGSAPPPADEFDAAFDSLIGEPPPKPKR